MEIRSKDRWCKCNNCGHKLFREISGVYTQSPIVNAPNIEIKCHSCKKINSIYITK